MLVLFAEFGGENAPLGGHERLSLPGLDCELELCVEARSVRRGFGGSENEVVPALPFNARRRVCPAAAAR